MCMQNFIKSIKQKLNKRKQKHSLLSKRAEGELSEITGYNLPSALKFIDPLYKPSRHSFIVLSIGFGLILLFLYFSHCFYEFYTTEKNSLSGLISINIGIASIVIALVIFVIQSTQERKLSRLVLLYKSYLWLLSFLSIATLMVYLVFILFWAKSHIPIVIALPTVIYALISLRALYQTIKLNTNSEALSEQTINVLTEQISPYLKSLFTHRIMENLFFDKVKSVSKKFLLVSPTQEHISQYTNFELQKTGYIADINMGNLELLLEKLQSILQKVSDEEKFNTSYHIDKILIGKSIFERISPQDKIVLSIPSAMINTDFSKKEIGNLLNKTFVIKDVDITKSTNPIIADIKGLRTDLIKAINENNLVEIEYFVEIYIQIGESFIEIFNKNIKNFKIEHAQTERNAIKHRMNYLEEIRDSIYSCLEFANRTNEKSIFREIAAVPIQYLSLAYHCKNPLFYLVFADYPIYFYEYSTKIKSTEPKNKNFYLKQLELGVGSLLKYDIYYEYKNTTNKEEKKEIFEYGDIIYKTIKYLLIGCYRKDDLENFTYFNNKFSKLFELEKEENQHYRRRTNKTINWETSFTHRMEIINFVLASVFLSEFKEKEEAKEFLDNTLGKIQSLEIHDLLNLYIYTHENSDGWEWDRFDMVEFGEVYSNKTSHRLADLLVYMLLKKENLSEINIDSFKDQIKKTFLKHLETNVLLHESINRLEGKEKENLRKFFKANKRNK